MRKDVRSGGKVPPASKGQKTRTRLVLLALVAAVAGPFLLLGAYALATRRLLSGPTLRALINASPQSFRIDWDDASSSWPGSVHIRNLRLRGSDPNVEWSVDLAEADLHYSLPALLRRTFLCTRLVGSGLSFALRTKIEPEAVKSTDTSVLPRIPGFTDPPLRSAGEVFQMEPNPWHVDVRSVAIDRFEDIWVNSVHYRGPARVEGGFLLWPTRLARIDAALLRFDGGLLTIGRTPDRVSLTGTFATTSRPFEPVKAPMPEALREFAIDLKLQLSTPRLRAIEAYIRFPPGVHLEGNGPKAAITLASREGVANGNLTVSIRSGGARTRTYRLRGNLDAEIPIRRWSLLKAPSFDVSGAHVALADVHASGPEEARDWWGNFDVPAGKVGAAASGHIEARCRDARPLLALLGVNLPDWTGGLLKLDDLVARASVSATPGTIRVRDLEASGDNFRVQGQFAHDGKAGDGAFLIQSGILIIGVEVTPQATKLRPLFAKQWYAKLLKEKAAADT